MKSVTGKIAGGSDNNLSSALHSFSDLHVRFSSNNDEEFALLSDNGNKKVKKVTKRKSNLKSELERQESVTSRKIDQFQAARNGNLEHLKALFKDNISNLKIFFSRRDPETKLTALHYAARFHHLNICQFLIEQCHVEINKAGEDGMTPLHYIARFRVEKDSQADIYEKIVGYLIHSRADINARDDFLATPLHHACERNNVLCAKILLSANADIEAEDRQRMQPLHGACFYGSADTARVLIEHGANVLAADQTGAIPFAHACKNSHYNIFEMFFTIFNQHDKFDDVIKAVDTEKNTLLHLAVISANFPIVELLLSKNAELSAKREDGQTPIHLCAKNDSVEILEKLVDAGGNINDVDNENETILHKAAAHNKENVLAYALSKQKDTDFIVKKHNKGETALLLAAKFGHVRCVKLLLEAGADMFNDRDKCERGPVYLASMGNHIETLQVLLYHASEHVDKDKEQLAVNEIDRYSRTGLHAAADSGHVDIVKELLKKGASLTMKDDDEYTALMLCCKKNRLDVLKVFIEHINDHYKTARDRLNILEERDDGSNTALHIAASEGHSAIIKLLLTQNCDLQARNMISWLPIHCAADHGQYNSVLTLIENHSPIDPVDKNLQTPLHLASRSGHPDIVKILLKNGAEIDKRTTSGDNCLDLAIGSNANSVAETLVNNPKWELILRNAHYDKQTDRWDTPLRKLIRQMPDVALIVLNKCCTVLGTNKVDQTLSTKNDEQEKKKKKQRKQLTAEDILELEEQLNNKNADTSGLTKDDTQFHKLTFVYSYEFLDDQFLLTYWADKKSEKTFEPDGRLYPYMFTEQPKDRKNIQLDHPFTLMVEYNREYLLDHPLVHSLLDYKWKLYARYVYYINFLFYLLFVASLTTYVFLTFAPYRFNITHDQMSEFSCYELCSIVKTNHTEELETLKPRIQVIHVFKWLVIVLASIQIVKEIFQMASELLDYINLENAVELSAFILAIIFTVDLNSCSREIGYRCVVQWQIGALGVFLTWFALVLFIQKFPRFGIYVVMLTDILHTFSRFFLVFFLFIIGFALAFHMLLQNHNPFQHFGNSLLKTCVMMIGEFEYEGIFHGEDANYFVGLAVDDIASVMRVATVKRLEMRVKLTLDVERKLRKQNLFSSIRRFRVIDYQSSYWQDLLNRTFRIQIDTPFLKNSTRLQEYGLLHTRGNQDSKTTSTNIPKIDDKAKSAAAAIGSSGVGLSTEWITTMHTQINTKYHEFNRHMTDLKTQQEKINNILQQFPTASTSRHSSHLTFAPTTA
ncbi:unnamed protein product [Adineta steineri]|uniref:Transient receptor potential cation channel subfamily A member 1 n=1 Tax=Adineta steineri TaxID=433720 RepID=A0A815BJ66_9BILA|nr:unnamed protein product [Adineta steineri]